MRHAEKKKEILRKKLAAALKADRKETRRRS